MLRVCAWLCTLIACGFAAVAAWSSVQGAVVQYNDPTLQYVVAALAISSDVFKVGACHFALALGFWRGWWLWLTFILFAGISLYLSAVYTDHAEAKAAAARLRAVEEQRIEAIREVEQYEAWAKTRKETEERLAKARAERAGNKPLTNTELQDKLSTLPRGNDRLDAVRENTRRQDLYNETGELIAMLTEQLKGVRGEPSAHVRALAQGARAPETSTDRAPSAHPFEHLAQWVRAHPVPISLEVLVLIWLGAAHLTPLLGARMAQPRASAHLPRTDRAPERAPQNEQGPISKTSSERAPRRAVSAHLLVEHLEQHGGRAVMSIRAWSRTLDVSAHSIKTWAMQLEAQGKVRRKETDAGLELEIVDKSLQLVVVNRN